VHTIHTCFSTIYWSASCDGIFQALRNAPSRCAYNMAAFCQVILSAFSMEQIYSTYTSLRSVSGKAFLPLLLILFAQQLRQCLCICAYAHTFSRLLLCPPTGCSRLISGDNFYKKKMRASDYITHFSHRHCCKYKKTACLRYADCTRTSLRDSTSLVFFLAWCLWCRCL